MFAESSDEEQIIGRVAALDIGKALLFMPLIPQFPELCRDHVIGGRSPLVHYTRYKRCGHPYPSGRAGLSLGCGVLTWSFAAILCGDPQSGSAQLKGEQSHEDVFHRGHSG